MGDRILSSPFHVSRQLVPDYVPSVTPVPVSTFLFTPYTHPPYPHYSPIPRKILIDEYHPSLLHI